MDTNAERILADAAWLKRLALTLATDADDADDLVQETWIAAWRKQPATDRSLRPWLGKVVRDIAGMRRRSDRRRDAREPSGRDNDAEPVQPDAALDQLRLHRLLADLVLELDEPYRSTVVARFVECRTSAEIARSLGIPNATVRARLREALARLRAQLDARNGDRKAWAPAVLAFAKGGLKVAKPMKPSAIVIALLALLFVAIAIVVIIAWRGSSTDDVAIHEASPPPSVPRTEPASSTATLRPSKPAGWIEQEGAASRRIAGRVISDHHPTAGVLVRLTSELSRAGMVARLEQRTDAEGRFDFGVQPPRPYEVGAATDGRLAAIAHVDLRRPNARPAPDALVLDLATCTAGLFGHVVDAQGTPIAHAEVLREDVIGTETGADGSFELCVLPSGLDRTDLRIDVRASGFGAITSMITPIGRTRRDFVLGPEAIIEGRVETDDHAPIEGAQVRVEADNPVVPFGAEQAAPAATTSAADGRFRIEGLGPGRHIVTARARAMSSAPSTIAVGAGDSQEITLLMIATGIVRGTVRLDGKPVEGVRVAAPGADDAITQSDGTFVMDRVPLGDIEFATTTHRVKTPHATRIIAGDNTITLDVEGLAVVSGMVTRDGIPTPRARVAVVGDRGAVWRGTYADDTGRYSIDGIAPGSYELRSDAVAIGATAIPKSFAIELSEHRAIDVDLTNGAHVLGIVVDAKNVPVQGAKVVFARADKPNDTGWCLTNVSGDFDCGAIVGGGTYVASVYGDQDSSNAFPFVDNTPSVAIVDGHARVDGIRLKVDARRHSIRGVVVDVVGATISDARVAITNATTVATTTMTGLRGEFEFRDLAPGTYSFHVDGPAGGTTESTLIATDSNEIKIVLPAPTCQTATSRTEPEVKMRPSGRVVWDDKIELIGWDIPTSVRVGEKFDVAIYFRALQPVGRSWKTFMHLDLPGPGGGRANADHDPIGGHCPTSTWKPGDILVDRFTTSVTTNAFGGAALGPGSYQIWIGFFRGWFREWIDMPISDAPASLRDDVYKRINLRTISVER